MSAILVDAVVANGKIRILDEPFYLTRVERMAKKWGDGCALTIRIEPEADAAKHHHYKHLFGHLLEPMSEYTGYTVSECKDDMKARFLPDGMVSLTDMDADQFAEFNRSVEQCIREEIPMAWTLCAAAMALYDKKTA